MDDHDHDLAARHDAKQDALAARYEAAGRKLQESLDGIGRYGLFECDEGTTTFSFLSEAFLAEFAGFDTHPTFTVEIDDFRTEVQYDVTQMDRFEEEIDLFEHLAENPEYWCLDAYEIAKSIRKAEAA